MERCRWVDLNSKEYIDYHDKFWGVPVVDDRLLFEMLCLESAQAGLSWLTILKKQPNYKLAFDDFDSQLVANYDQTKIEELLGNKGIIRNKRKVLSCIRNAKVFLEIQKEFSSFAYYLWRFVDFTPFDSKIENSQQLPIWTPLAKEVSADLIKRGMNFVGPTIIYSFLQAVGVVNDHIVSCFRYEEVKGLEHIVREKLIEN